MRESPLDVLLQDGVIDEVVGRLNSGKEADIFLVQHRGRVVAAKVYRDREQRSFKVPRALADVTEDDVARGCFGVATSAKGGAA
jgi:RIO kinase 1